MELNMQGGIRRQAAATQAQRPGAAPTRPETQATVKQGQPAREDKLELSPEALAFLEGQPESAGAAGAAGDAPQEGGIQAPLSPAEKRQQAQAEKLKTAKQMLDILREQSAQMKEQNEKQAEAMKKAMDKMKKCMRIARNISKGHKVPHQDEKYLLENDPKAYMMAVMMRMMEEEKKKVKSELDEEDARNETQEAGPVEGAGTVEGGGEICVDAPAEVSVE